MLITGVPLYIHVDVYIAVWYCSVSRGIYSAVTSPARARAVAGRVGGGREEGGFLCASAVRGASALRLRGHRVFLSLFRGWVGGSEK